MRGLSTETSDQRPENSDQWSLIRVCGAEENESRKLGKGTGKGVFFAEKTVEKACFWGI